MNRYATIESYSKNPGDKYILVKYEDGEVVVTYNMDQRTEGEHWVQYFKHHPQWKTLTEEQTDPLRFALNPGAYMSMSLMPYTIDTEDKYNKLVKDISARGDMRVVICSRKERPSW